MTVDYLRTDGTHCKGCGKLIFPNREGHLPEAEYCDLYLVLTDADGRESPYSTPMCRPCAEAVGPADLCSLYLADVLAFEKELPALGPVQRATVRAFIEQQKHLAPVRVDRVEPVRS